MVARIFAPWAKKKCPFDVEEFFFLENVTFEEPGCRHHTCHNLLNKGTLGNGKKMSKIVLV